MAGFCFARLISSATVLTPSEGCTARTTGWRVSWMSGTKSFSGSKFAFSTWGALAIASVVTRMV